MDAVPGETNSSDFYSRLSIFLWIFSISSLPKAEAMAQAMMAIPAILIAKRESAKRLPKADISNNNMGIFVVDHAPIKIIILKSDAPFFIRIAATGKAPYRGPAAKDPNKKARTGPYSPESLPKYLIIFSLGTHISNSPRRTKIGGMTKSIVLA